MTQYDLCGLFSARLRCRLWRASARRRPPPCLSSSAGDWSNKSMGSCLANLCIVLAEDQYELCLQRDAYAEARAFFRSRLVIRARETAHRAMTATWVAAFT